MKTIKRQCCHISCDNEATKTVFYDYTDSGSNDFCENHLSEHTNVFEYKSIEDISKNENIIKPGILPKKGGKKNKNVYYGRRY